MCAIYSQCENKHGNCPTEDPNSDWVVIGYDPNRDNLNLFKVYQGLNTRHATVAETQDNVSASIARTNPTIIYTVVRKSDLWW